MRAVTGRIVSSRPISLSRASKTLSRFAASPTAAAGRPEAAAYLRRAAAAFEELVSVHRELRTANNGEASSLDPDSRQEKRSKKRKIGEVGGDGVLAVGDRCFERGVVGGTKGGVLGPVEVRGVERSDFDGGERRSVGFDGASMRGDEVVRSSELGIDGKRKKRKGNDHGKGENEGMKGEEKDFDNAEKVAADSVKLVNGVRLDDDDDDDGVVRLDEGKKRKKKKVNKEKNNVEAGDEKMVAIREEEKPREEMKKNKEKKIKEKKITYEKENSVKKQEDLPVEVGLGGNDDQIEQHKKKKKRRKEMA